MKNKFTLWKSWLFFGMVLIGAASLTAFPLWLDAPVRSNPFDPKSDLFTKIALATATPVATPTPYAGTPTETGTATYSPTPNPSPSPTATQTPCVGCVIFEDFDFDITLKSGFTYADSGNGASLTSDVSSTVSHSGGNSLHMFTTTTSAAYGAGAGCDSNYGAAAPVFQDMTGTNNFTFWMKSDQAITFSVRFMEHDDWLDANNENWQSPDQSATGDNAWHFFSIPISSFFEDAYGEQPCSGTCDQAGNGDNLMQLNQIGRFQIQINGGATAVTNANTWLDDITFMP